MFNDLTQKFQRLFKNLRGHGKLTEKNIEDALRDVRLALLEADVNFKVVKQFIQKVKDGVLGSNVVTSVTPGQQFIKMLNNEMVSFLSGGEPETIKSNDNIILMTGLQGSGKTTTCGKLGLVLKRGGKKILMAACDIHRPAAIDQLEQVGKRLDIDVFADRALNDAVKIAEMAVRRFTDGGYDHLIVDTAGRLHVDSSMMEEIKKIKTVTSPSKIYFVADSCTGQDAVVSADSFHKALDFTGVILTKLDGDTRGGAAISIKHVTGRPVVYVGVGEKSQDFEVFYPDRMVSRILGMGDIVTLVEKSEEAFDKKEAERLIKKVKKNALDLEDFMVQLKQFKKMGSLSDIMGYLPGGAKLKGLKVDDKELVRSEAIISSMTVEERKNPSIIKGSRRKRIADGSGTTVQDVNKLLKRFEMTAKMMKNVGKMGSRIPNFPGVGF